MNEMMNSTDCGNCNLCYESAPNNVQIDGRAKKRGRGLACEIFNKLDEMSFSQKIFTKGHALNFHFNFQDFNFQVNVQPSTFNAEKF